jgi:4-hydroxy-tetrahydrodipicolinate reductase
VKIGLSGYGRMGRAVEKTALERGHEIIFRMDTPGDWKSNEKLIGAAGVVIDFSFPESAFENIMTCFDHDVAVVSGTTGWLDRFPEIERRCTRENKALVYAPNFNIGVNVLFSMNRKLAEIMAGIPEYRARLGETHHIHKKDAPSGTAIKLAEEIIRHHPGYTRWIKGVDGKEDELPVESTREGEVVGIHTIRYHSGFDELQLQHIAKDRAGFAVGAVIAAEWLDGKTGCFSMQDVLGL